MEEKKKSKDDDDDLYGWSLVPSNNYVRLSEYFCNQISWGLSINLLICGTGANV